MLSANGGGALIPCGSDYYDDDENPDPAHAVQHDQAWEELESSGAKARFDADVKRLTER
jgi:hypothetical protein